MLRFIFPCEAASNALLSISSQLAISQVISLSNSGLSARISFSMQSTSSLSLESFGMNTLALLTGLHMPQLVAFPPLLKQPSAIYYLFLCQLLHHRLEQLHWNTRILCSLFQSTHLHSRICSTSCSQNSIFVQTLVPLSTCGNLGLGSLLACSGVENDLPMAVANSMLLDFIKLFPNRRNPGKILVQVEVQSLFGAFGGKTPRKIFVHPIKIESLLWCFVGLSHDSLLLSQVMG